MWPLAPVLLKHLEVAFVGRDVENSLDDFRIGVVHIELPDPVRAPILREVGRRVIIPSLSVVHDSPKSP